MGSSFFDFREQLFRANRPPRDPAENPAPVSRDDPWTVSQLTQHIERALKSQLPPTVLVRGECSNCKPHQSSGHFYFTLKDANACIDCVMFRDDFRSVTFAPDDGIEMLATGRIGIYGQRGRYQLYCIRLEPLGRGALELAFQQLCKKLQREGLFEADRKKPLPRYPMHVAIVTSRATAALQDILKVLRRFPWIKVSLVNVPVQGKGAAAKIADTLRRLSARRDMDVILLARGGGSLEDLWEFNEEAVARAVAESAIPIVTGIGHEVDTSIADLAADFHAHTPTEAAQVVTAHWRTAPAELSEMSLRLRRAAAARVELARHQLASIERHEAFRRPLDRINQLRQWMDDRQRTLNMTARGRINALRTELRELEDRLSAARPAVQIARMHERLARAEARLVLRHPRHLIRLAGQRAQMVTERLRCAILLDQQRHAARLAALDRQLQAVNPQAVLRRGYSMTLLKKDNSILRSASQLRGGERLITKLADGQVESTADDPQQPRLF